MLPVTQPRHVHQADDLLWVSAGPIDDGRILVSVVGEVDHYTVPLLSACLNAHIGRRGVRELVIDLEGVTFLSAAGLAALEHTRRRCMAQGTCLRLRCNARGAVLRPLQLTGLAELFTIDPGGGSYRGVGSGNNRSGVVVRTLSRAGKHTGRGRHVRAR